MGDLPPPDPPEPINTPPAKDRPAVSATRSDILLDRMMALHPKLIDLTLDRMWRILGALGHPERGCRPSSTSPAPTARARRWR
jgi:hypothetical protein